MPYDQLVKICLQQLDKKELATGQIKMDAY